MATIRKCGFKECKFNKKGDCTQKADLGQNNLVSRLIKLAEEADAYGFYDSFESMEQCEKETENDLSTREGVESLISFCNDILEESNDNELYPEAEVLKQVLTTLLSTM